jgi:hypothetical protein
MSPRQHGAAYRRAIDRWPGTEVDAWCRLWLAGAYQYRGRFEQALDEAKQASEVFAGTTEGPNADHTIGLIYLQSLHGPARAAPRFHNVRAGAAGMTDPQERVKWEAAAAQGLARCEAEGKGKGK